MESEDERIERLRNERDALRLQLARIQVETLKRQVQALQEAPADSPGEENIRTQVLDLVGNGRSVRQLPSNSISARAEWDASKDSGTNVGQSWGSKLKVRKGGKSWQDSISVCSLQPKHWVLHRKQRFIDNRLLVV